MDSKVRYACMRFSRIFDADYSEEIKIEKLYIYILKGINDS